MPSKPKMTKIKTGIGARINKALNNFMDDPTATRFKEGTATPLDSARARGWNTSMGDYRGDAEAMPKMDPQQAFADTKSGSSSTAPRATSHPHPRLVRVKNRST